MTISIHTFVQKFEGAQKGGGPKGWDPEVGPKGWEGPKPRKSEGPERLGAEDGGPELWVPKDVEPKFSRFFPLPHHFFALFCSLGGLVVELKSRFKDIDHPSVRLDFSGVIFREPLFPTGRWGKGGPGKWGLRGGSGVDLQEMLGKICFWMKSSLVETV